MARLTQSRAPVLMRGSPQKRATSWTRGPFGTYTRTASGNALIANGQQALLDGLTIVRLRGEVTAFLSSATTALDGYTGAFGIGIANENAFNAGVASVNIPVTDVAWEGWLYHQFFSCKAHTSGEVTGQCANYRFEIDSKAMRKIKLGDVVYAAIEVLEVGAATLNGHFDTRMLSKLS